MSDKFKKLWFGSNPGINVNPTADGLCPSGRRGPKGCCPCNPNPNPNPNPQNQGGGVNNSTKYTSGKSNVGLMKDQMTPKSCEELSLEESNETISCYEENGNERECYDGKGNKLRCYCDPEKKGRILCCESIKEDSTARTEKTAV